MIGELKDALLQKIRDKSAKLLVIGMGYVGTPLAVSFAREGFNVIGYDVNPEKVNSLNQGIYPIKGNEPGMPELVAEVVSKGNFRATTNPGLIASSDVIFVVVDTPLIGPDHDRRPNLTNLERACEQIGTYLKEGAMVIIESTLAPLTMQKTVQPILEDVSGLKAGVDFSLGHCPERVMPGRLLYNLANYDRIVGGINDDACEIACELYSHIVKGDLIPMNLIEAEFSKTAENYVRDVRIATANMLALLCDDLGANVYRVRDMLNKLRSQVPEPYLLMPGAGVGGHCIPKDSVLMIANASSAFRSAGGFDGLVLTCRDLNDYMPVHMIELFDEAFKAEPKLLPDDLYYEFVVAVLGYSYLPESDDDRCSPTQTFLEHLDEENESRIQHNLHAITELRLHDPFVPRENMHRGLEKCGSFINCDNRTYSIARYWEEAVADADAVVVMVAHDEYKNIALEELKACMRGNIIIDGRNVFDKDSARELGFIYKGIGNTC